MSIKTRQLHKRRDVKKFEHPLKNFNWTAAANAFGRAMDFVVQLTDKVADSLTELASKIECAACPMNERDQHTGKPLKDMFPIGSRVSHIRHGAGTVIGYSHMQVTVEFDESIPGGNYIAHVMAKNLEKLP